MKLNFIIGVVSIVSMTIWINVRQKNEDENKADFYKKNLSTTVVKVNLVDGRVNEFHLKNGLRIYLAPHAYGKIIVGDSIKKQKNTYLYQVYRKSSDNNYGLLATYDFRDVWK